MGGFRDHVFDAKLPTRATGGWVWSITGQVLLARYGPRRTLHEAQGERMRVLQRWKRAARSRGGWLWLQTAERWVVTLPEGLETRGRPLAHRRMNRG
ncbi:MAG: hypothetical protein JRI25_21465 [Deltaproteobacteria bacterium]|nr:hypothetical protein [Deltaproteobacteria bacterium]